METLRRFSGCRLGSFLGMNGHHTCSRVRSNAAAGVPLTEVGSGQLQLALPSTVRAEVSPLQRSEQREPEPQLSEHAPVHWI